MLSENELLLHGILPIASEDKCILGMPLKEPITEEQTNTVRNIFKKNIEPRYVKSLKKQPIQHQTIYRGNGRLEFE